MEQLCFGNIQFDDYNAAYRDHCLDHRPHLMAWQGRLGLFGLQSHRYAGARFGYRNIVALVSLAPAGLRDLVDSADCLCHQVSSLRHASLLFVDVADQKRARGGFGSKRRKLVLYVQARDSSFARAGFRSGVDLRDHSLFPGAFHFDHALSKRH